ncbi:hypothetical protein [Rhizobium sp. SG741]|uniref:hypothetical protein n=1 Tax=Rhizobium sp. SG741 TaxID=2587114 RepID=UPI001FEE8AF5|nr:hypothetical protein [Rhizobium sp. SG741]
MCRGFKSLLRYHQNSRQLFADNCGQPALNFVLIFFAWLAWVDDYTRDHFPEGLSKLDRRFSAGTIGDIGELLDILPEFLDSLWFQLDDVGWSLFGLKFSFQAHPLSFEPGKNGQNVLIRDCSPRNLLNHTRNSDLHVCQRVFLCAAAIASLGGNSLALSPIFFDIGVYGGSVGEHDAQAINHVAFDLLDIVARVV